jgi:hypothetical protein
VYVQRILYVLTADDKAYGRNRPACVRAYGTLAALILRLHLSDTERTDLTSGGVSHKMTAHEKFYLFLLILQQQRQHPKYVAEVF